MPVPARNLIDAIERFAAPLVATLLVAGIGAVGWLVGHVLAYDALGRAHLHAGHAYMQPVEYGGAVFVFAAALVALVAITLARSAFIRWMRSALDRDQFPLWVASAMLPATTYFAVELLQGSLTGGGDAVLLVGMPLQALIGMAVLWLVRELLDVIVEIAECVGGHVERAVRTPLVLAVTNVAHVPATVCPMATCAPRRGPPHTSP